MPTEAANFVWTDTALFERRYEKSTCALIAVKQAVERNDILSGREGEFLDLYDSLSQANPEDFTRVWSDPTAYFWVRIAYELVKTCLTGESLSSFTRGYCEAVGFIESRDALAFHLAEFKKFVLAVHALSGQDCSFKQPFRPLLPSAIPGTSLFLEGKGSFEIRAFTGGKLRLNYEGQEVSLALCPGSSLDGNSLQVRECLTLNFKGCKLLLQPYSFNLPGVEDGQPAVETGIAYHEEHANLIQETLALIDRYQPKTFAQMRDFLQILALKPLRAGTYTNLSHSDLPGALICSVIDNPYELADTLIHEFHHNRLFFIEEMGPLLLNSVNDSDLLQNGGFYSPWRNDLRPLRGLLHALYVYLPVCRFWLQVFRDDEVAGKQLDYVRSQLIRIPLQLKIAAFQLDRYAHFTDFGSELFAELKAEVTQLASASAELDLPDDVPSLLCREDGALLNECRQSDGRQLSVRESILDHIYCYDTAKQCEGILQDLSLT